MSGLTNALQELRAERARAQAQVVKLDRAISVMESLNGSGTSNAATSSETSHTATQPKRIISAASRRKMALGQKARWAKARQKSQPMTVVKTTGPAPVKRTMSASARRRIAAAQRARWAKVKAQQNKAA